MEIINRFSAAEIQEYSHLVSAWTHLAQQKGEAVLYQKPENLASQMHQGLTNISLNSEGNPVGHITVWSLVKNVFEAGTLFVKWDFRSQGISTLLIAENSVNHPEKQLIATTKNERAIKAFHTAGYEDIYFANIGRNVRQGLCYEAPCFVHNGSKHTCIKEENPCYALIRRPLC